MSKEEYLVLHQLRQGPSDMLLQPVESNRWLVSQDVHTLREFVTHCGSEIPRKMITQMEYLI